MFWSLLTSVFAICVTFCSASVISNATRQGTTHCHSEDQRGEKKCYGYMCLDWTFGSDEMAYAQSFYTDTLFAVGSYGSSENLGKCYEFQPTGTHWKFVFQVINQGTDVLDGSFDIQTGAGGVGIYNACTMETLDGDPPMFSEDLGAFGEICGGIQSVESCSSAPASLQTLCERSFEWGGRDLDVVDIRRVQCPSHLYEITGLRLTTDDSPFSEELRPTGKTTTTMDCCRPSASFPCLEDGSTRMPSADPNYPYVLRCGLDGARVSRDTERCS